MSDREPLIHELWQGEGWGRIEQDVQDKPDGINFVQALTSIAGRFFKHWEAVAQS